MNNEKIQADIIISSDSDSVRHTHTHTLFVHTFRHVVFLTDFSESVGSLGVTNTDGVRIVTGMPSDLVVMHWYCLDTLIF